ncbi:MAG: acetate kinase [Aestuariivirga sp.]|uniref:acetate/propionate family kinase n=1 Tax=Aestuariivirga sp. TaxID=2650926 RepID=UPI0025BDDE4C|nr:acetate kinase [Aestuariivirga sp.]MCA3559737.1 acetate kinase [Aestuariivirga sp.]
MNILVLNAGSSSLKFAVFDGGLKLLMKGQVSGIGSKPRLEADGHSSREVPHVTSPGEGLLVAAEWLADNGHEPGQFIGIGHRIVHGGTQYVSPVVVDDQVQRDLDALRMLAPLHLPFGLGVLREMRRVAPEVPNIACFDTAFHATQPELATRLPLPRNYFDKGYRRYGFHGLNYQHVVEALPRISGKPLPRRLLAAHLGSGASMCAIFDGKSVATTMGFSTADGLVMGTRTGSIDPGVLVALMRDEHMDPGQLEDLLYRRSGLLGLSGISADMRVLLASGRTEASEAVDHYCYSAARHAASLVPALGGVDAMAFTGGVGENAETVRERIMSRLEWLGIGPGNVYVVPANEELAIARGVKELL